jgi:CheY-like chemotaxis protein
MYNQNSSSPKSALDGRKLILSVDDELGILYSRYRLLAASGYDVLSATDGVQALQVFGNSPVDLVLLDFALQGMDGGVVAESMKEFKPHISIIMLSGIEVPERCLAIVNSYVQKGEGPEALLKSIQQLLTSTAHPRLVTRQAAS